MPKLPQGSPYGGVISLAEWIYNVMGTLYSLATIFLLLTINPKENKTTFFLSQISYSIYLSHLFFVYLFIDLNWQLFHHSLPFYITPILFAFALGGSLLVYFVGKLLFRDRSYLIIGA